MEDKNKPIIEIIKPEFIVGINNVIELQINPNDYKDEKVYGFIGTTNPYGVSKIEKFTNEDWEEIKINDFFDKENGIILNNTPLRFRISFNNSADYMFEIQLLSFESNITIADKDFSLIVKDSQIIEGTKYEEIYEQFLSAITDDRYSYMTEEELMIDLLPLLKRSIYYLCRIAKVSGFNLHNRDDNNNIFINRLTEHEIEVLAWAMVVCWVEQQLNSNRLIQQQYYDAGIKTYSPNETMRNLLTLHDNYYKRLKNRLTEYNYKVVDISKFGGKD